MKWSNSSVWYAGAPVESGRKRLKSVNLTVCTIGRTEMPPFLAQMKH